VCMKISVIGAGYVGLVAACCLANSGHEVTCIERDDQKRKKIQEGIVPFYEDGLEGLLVKGLESGRLSFSADLSKATSAPVVMVAVGTPSGPDGMVDLSQIYDVMTAVAEQPLKPRVLVIKSTVPPGLGAQLQRLFLSGKGSGTAYISNPEFLREGQAVMDWYNPDRIVLGGDNREAVELVKGLYRDIKAPVCVMDITSAEMVKYASNAFLATKISFINEIANLCDLMEADITSVSMAVGLDRRIGSHYLQAGLGYGGSCFPKDTRGLNFISTFNGYTFNLLKAVIEVNFQQRILAIRKLSQHLGSLGDKRVGMLGLSFKSGTDDMRESPSLDIIRMLINQGARVSAYDPKSGVGGEKLLPPGCKLHFDAMSAVSGCHAVVVATDWQEFTKMDWKAARERMLYPYVLLDGRNCLDPGKLRESGIRYIGMGKR